MRRWLRVSGWFFVSALFAVALLAAGCNSYNTALQGNTGATLIFIAPSNVIAGGGDFTLTVAGSGFANNTVVRWNGQDRVTTYNTTTPTTLISATIKAADIAKPGTALVNTFTPQSGTGQNGLSNVLVFTIYPKPNPVPAIASISPNTTAAQACNGTGTDPCSPTAFTLTVTGSNFITPTNASDPTTGSVVHWNQGAIQYTLIPTSISSTQISAPVTEQQIKTAGTAIVTVFNPSPGGGTSPNGLTFTITPDPPAAPGSAAAALASADSPAISQDGRYVAFVSSDSGHSQVYVRDTCAGADKGCEQKTALISANPSGDPAQGDSRAPAMSADGRYVAFESDAKDLVASVPAGRQVFLRDTCAGASADCQSTTTLVSSDSAVPEGNENISPVISATGRFVAFVSVTPARGGKSAPGQVNSGFRQVFVRDTCLGATDCTPRSIQISLHPGDTAAPGGTAKPAMSEDGQHVALPAPISNIFTPSVAVDDKVFVALTAPSSR